MYRKGDTAFITHPKTASQSVRIALTAAGWERTSGHHDIDLPMPKNVISVIREPEDWYVSWYFHMQRELSFEGWLPEFIEFNHYSCKGFFGLQHTTHLVFYSDLHAGLDAVFEDLELPTIELEIVNRKHRNGRPASEFFTDELRCLLPARMVKAYARLLDQLTGTYLCLR